jgi:hypothetical protein
MIQIILHKRKVDLWWSEVEAPSPGGLGQSEAVRLGVRVPPPYDTGHISLLGFPLIILTSSCKPPLLAL